MIGQRGRGRRLEGVNRKNNHTRKDQGRGEPAEDCRGETLGNGQVEVANY